MIIARLKELANFENFLVQFLAMQRLEVEVHPDFRRNYWLRDMPTGEEFSEITVFPGEFMACWLIRCSDDGSFVELLSIMFDFQKNEGKEVEYRYYVPHALISTLPDESKAKAEGLVHTDQARSITPGNLGELQVAPVILRGF